MFENRFGYDENMKKLDTHNMWSIRYKSWIYFIAWELFVRWYEFQGSKFRDSIKIGKTEVISQPYKVINYWQVN